MFCNTLCEHTWDEPHIPGVGFHNKEFEVLRCTCASCADVSYWLQRDDAKSDSGVQIYPLAVNVPMPHQLLSPDCQVDYLEARAILANSPRGAAALLRLCIQKLLMQLGEKGENINADIGALVKKGLSAKVQKALDICRVVGNNAVHPGEMDLSDTPDVAQKLFSYVNFIVEEMIERPKQIEEMFDSLPEGARSGIGFRDAPRAKA